MLQCLLLISGQIGLVAFGEDVQHHDLIKGIGEVIDNSRSSALPMSFCSNPDLSQTACARDNLSHVRIVDEVELEITIIVIRDEPRNPFRKIRCFNNDHYYVIGV